MEDSIIKIVKIICVSALTIIFSLSVYAANPPPTTWDNYVDGKHYSIWYLVSGQMPGPLTYKDDVDYGATGIVTVNFENNGTGVSAQEDGSDTHGPVSCLYNGNVTNDSSGRPSTANGTVICSGNPSHGWNAVMNYNPPMNKK